MVPLLLMCFFYQAEDGIRNLVRSRGLGDVYKRQDQEIGAEVEIEAVLRAGAHPSAHGGLALEQLDLHLSLIHI